MGLSVGIVGLPNVGKSTLFNALLKKQQAFVANYPFVTIEPNVGIVPVPDDRLAKLAEIVHTEKIVPATVTFVDIAGIVKGANEGEGLGNKFLSHIREADAIAYVVRAFEDGEVVQTGNMNVGDDLATVKTELALADLQTLGKQKEPKGAITPEMKQWWGVIQKLSQVLNAGKSAVDAGLTDDEQESVRDLCLITAKPVLYVINAGESELGIKNNELRNEYAQKIGVSADDVVVICAKIESELAGLGEDDAKEYLKELGLLESGLERLIQAGYQKLGLLSFLTAGEKEVRAWTIKHGTKAPQSAGVIHTDFEKKFIKADVVGYEDFFKLGGWKMCRDVGKVRSEGKDYIIREGDVVEFKIGT